MLWSDEIEVKLCGHDSKRQIWHKNNTLHHQKNPPPKQTPYPWWIMVVFSIMLRGFFSLAGSEALVKVKWVMNSSKSRSLLAPKVPARRLKMKKNFTTLTSSMHPNQQKNCFTGRKLNFCNSPGRAQTSQSDKIGTHLQGRAGKYCRVTIRHADRLLPKKSECSEFV